MRWKGARSLGAGEVGGKWEDPRGGGPADGISRGPRSDDGRQCVSWLRVTADVVLSAFTSSHASGVLTGMLKCPSLNSERGDSDRETWTTVFRHAAGRYGLSKRSSLSSDLWRRRNETESMIPANVMYST